MQDQIACGNIKTELFKLGGRAMHCATSKKPALREKKQEALNLFLEFIEQIPNTTEDDLEQVDGDFGFALARAGLDFGRLDPTFGGVAMPLGSALGGLGRKKLISVDQAKNHLIRAMRGGDKWERNNSPFTMRRRLDALDLTLSAVNEMEALAEPDVACVATQTGVFPYYTDMSMVEGLASYMETARAAPVREIAERATLRTRDTIGMLLAVNPDLEDTMRATVDDITEKVFSEELPLEEIRPVVVCAVTLTRQAIGKAARKAHASREIHGRRMPLRPTEYPFG